MRSISSRTLFSIAVALILSALPASAAIPAQDAVSPDEISASRKSWERIPVPGAKCGDGGEYSIFIRKGIQDKVALAFMGGGACWSESTCMGVEIKTFLPLVPFVPIAGGFVSNDPEVSPVAGWSTVFFPYCTGDLFVSDHIARYGKHEVHHVGRSNVARSIELLRQRKLLDFNGATDLVVWGPSAGALAALFHAQTLDQAFPKAKRKSLIADAPGLHFGDGVWSQFTPQQIEDFSAGLARAGIPFDPSRGVIADIVPGLCRALPHWSVGVMQGSKDFVMSRIFGKISMREHARLIHSPEGVLALTDDPSDLCRAWVAETPIHTFLPTSAVLGVEVGGVSAKDFLWQVVERRGGANLQD